MESSVSSLAAERMVMQSDFDGLSMAFVLENSVCVRDDPAFLHLRAKSSPIIQKSDCRQHFSKCQCEVAPNLFRPCPSGSLNQTECPRSGNNNVPRFQAYA